MQRAALALLAALLLAPLAAAQFYAVPVESRGEMVIGGGLVELRIETAERDMPLTFPWLVAGFDNVVNLTVSNPKEEPMNATFTLNVTGATASVATVLVDVPGYGQGGATFVLHPDDVGLVEVEAVASDAFGVDGKPLRLEVDIPAVLLPAIRFLDPPLVNMSPGDPEFVRGDHMFGGTREGELAYLRIPPGTAIEPRIEVRNPFDVALPPFELRLTGAPQDIAPASVPALEPGEVSEVTFEEFVPVPRSSGFYGGTSIFELRPAATLSLAGSRHTVTPIDFRIDRGAVLEARVTRALIVVQDGLAIDLFVPRAPTLGVPTRVLYNLTNLETRPLQGTLVISLMTPNNLVYEVQAPEAREVPVSLGPGERTSGAIQLTPRVTGGWQVSSFFRGDDRFGFSYGTGASFEVKGPIRIGFDQTETVFARIGQPVEVGVVITSEETVQDATLRLASGSFYYRDPSTMGGSDHTPGLVSRLLRVEAASGSLGTLRPGGELNTSVTVVPRASGGYSIVPYVLAEGFAYTSTSGEMRGPIFRPMMPEPGFSSTLQLSVLPRAVPPALALLPLTVGLAFFVGMWTLRTRFVK